MIQQTLDSLPLFPREAAKGRNPDYRTSKVTWRCQAWNPPPRCNEGPVAITIASQWNDDDTWHIVFCNSFFKLDYIENLGGGSKKPISFLPVLESFEHAMIHELLHADISIKYSVAGDVRRHIGDLTFKDKRVEDCQERPVYGAIYSQFFAHRVQYDHYGDHYANYLVASNADNYAWYYTNRCFERRFEWHDDDGEDTLGADYKMNEGGAWTCTSLAQKASNESNVPMVDGVAIKLASPIVQSDINGEYNASRAANLSQVMYYYPHNASSDSVSTELKAFYYDPTIPPP
jgi:hypothetical protein